MSNSSEQADVLSPLKRALLAIKELKIKLEKAEKIANEPIAIIGMSCRMPGANNVVEFWDLLKNGKDGVSEVSYDKWDIDQYYDSEITTPGKMTSRWGAFLENIDQFDPLFFGISPREAAYIDPQQRIFLEVAWEALEDAGQTIEALSGSQTGVFVGVYNSDYAWMQLADINSINTYTGTGIAHSIIANRLSYCLNLKGPSLAVDTACSSSITAIHYACQSLRSHESNLAVAAGVNLILSPLSTVTVCKILGMAEDGRCKTFDSRADGIVRGEGCGVIILKRLSDAIADNDNILAVIQGSAINQDGRGAGLTAPNVLSQAAVIKAALENAHIESSQVDYIEAHGTGTSLGDPIEVEALSHVYNIRPDNSKCFISSVKSNIGHLEAAAGIAGLIKAILCLKNQTIVPNLHFQALNPNISLNNTPFLIPTKLYSWPKDKPRFASVSSFGLGGSNSHIIITDPPAITKETTLSDKYHLLTLSGKTEKVLLELVNKYETYLTETESNIEEICYSAAVRRSHHNERLAVIGETKTELLQQLKKWEKKQEFKRDRNKKKIKNSKIVFVFSGQGPQWWAMAQELMEKEEIFRKVIEDCSKELSKYADWDLEKELKATAQESRLGETQIAQPAIFALQVGLARLLESWGVKATSVVGHSVGEVAAAHIAGVLTLEDAIKVVYQRGHLMQRTTGLGKTAALGVSLAQAEQMLLGHQESLSIAANNSPSSVTISGETELLLQLSRQWQAQGIYCKLLKVDYAFHSPQMTPLQAELISLLSDIKPQPATKEICSTVTAEFQAKYDAQYWATNIRATVLFTQAIEQLIEKDNHTFIEISPHPVLALYLNEIAQSLDADVEVLSSLSRDITSSKRLSSLLAELYCLSYPLDFSRLFPTNSLVSLPSYPWQHQTYWLEPQTNPSSNLLTQTENWHKWLYQVKWLAKPFVSSSSIKKGFWLVITDHNVGKQVANLLESSGQKCLLVSLNKDLLDNQYYHNLLASITETDPNLSGIVYLSDVDNIEPNLANLVTEQEKSCFNVMQLVQAIAQINWTLTPPRLWLITKAAQPINNTVVSLSQTPIWGLGKVITLEHPELRCGRIDLSEFADTELEMLAKELLADLPEDQIAIHKQERYVARLQPVQITPIKSFTFVKESATYLITGGTGGVGLAVAEYLVRQGAKYLLLISRSGANPKTQEQINKIKAIVKVCALDISEPQEMARLSQELEHLPPLKGVIHCAGVLDDSTLLNLDRERFKKVMLPKLNGSWNLHTFTQDKELDFFVLFSSATSMLGSPGQANYAAANAFLDALARYRHSQDLPALSINWGFWAEVGMVKNSGEDLRLGQMGLGTIKPHQGVSILRNLIYQSLHTGVVEIGVIPINWDILVKTLPMVAEIPMFEDLVKNKKTNPNKPNLASSTLDIAAYNQEQVQEYISKVVTEIIGIANITYDTLLYDLGLDSLMAVELKNRIERDLNITLSIKTLFQQASIKWLTEEVKTKLPIETIEANETIEIIENHIVAQSTQGETVKQQPVEPLLAKSHLSSASNYPSDPWLVFPVPNPNAKVRLFCFAYAGGSATIFHSWPSKLSQEIEVCAIQLPGRGARLGENLLTSLPEVVTAVTNALAPYLDKPFAMFGHCVGAIIMFEVAKSIRHHYKKLPVQLFPSAAAAPPLYMATQAYTLPDSGFLETLKFINFSSTEALLQDTSLQEILLPCLRSDFEMAANYRYASEHSLGRPITAFGAWEDVFAPPNVINAWREHSDSNFSAIIYSGGHYFLENELPAILEQISQELANFFELTSPLTEPITEAFVAKESIVLSKPNVGEINSFQQPKVQTPNNALISLTPNRQAMMRLFCFPYAGGEANIFAHWPDNLPNLDVYSVELPGHGLRSKEPLLVSVEAMVEDLLPVFANYLDQPFVFFGHDLGAIIMFELNKKLYQSYGRTAKHLFVSGAVAPHLYYFPPVYVLPKARLINTLAYLDFPINLKDSCNSRLNLIRADFQAVSNYTYTNTPNIDIPITATFAKSDRFVPLYGMQQWVKYSSDFTFNTWIGNHYSWVKDNQDSFLEIISKKLL